MKTFYFIGSESDVVAGQLAGYSNEFSDSKFWGKLKRFFKYMGEKLVFNALLLYYVLKSEDVPFKVKTSIVIALGYLISPVDFIPDAVPVVGYSDDLTAILAVVQAVSDYATPEIVAMANSKTRAFFG